ncbi:MAG: branched-chain amino acid ABC transporter permease, partial [Burkholderia sp.]|nr:branched-chain amino acid ABC transporter permease [Burkholderia sp.]
MIDTSKSGVAKAAPQASGGRALGHTLHRYRFLLLSLLVVCILP